MARITVFKTVYVSSILAYLGMLLIFLEEYFKIFIKKHIYVYIIFTFSVIVFFLYLNNIIIFLWSYNFLILNYFFYYKMFFKNKYNINQTNLNFGPQHPAAHGVLRLAL